VYNSITDFAVFVDDTIRTVESAQRQDVSADPNQTVQAFIDLCARHEENLYKFIHEVHIHDNGLFDALMTWTEGILDFLRNGPKGGKLDMNALFQGGLSGGTIDKQKATREVNQLIKWQMARKRWHQDKTRQKMASGGAAEGDTSIGMNAFKSSDFGLNEVGFSWFPIPHIYYYRKRPPQKRQQRNNNNKSRKGGKSSISTWADLFPQLDLADLELDDAGADMDEEDEEELDEEEMDDPLAAERKRRLRQANALKRSAGEPKKPEVKELSKLMPGFNDMLRSVLAE